MLHSAADFLQSVPTACLLVEMQETKRILNGAYHPKMTPSEIVAKLPSPLNQDLLPAPQPLQATIEEPPKELKTIPEEAPPKPETETETETEAKWDDRRCISCGAVSWRFPIIRETSEKIFRLSHLPNFAVGRRCCNACDKKIQRKRKEPPTDEESTSKRPRPVTVLFAVEHFKLKDGRMMFAVCYERGFFTFKYLPVKGRDKWFVQDEDGVLLNWAINTKFETVECDRRTKLAQIQNGKYCEHKAFIDYLRVVLEPKADGSCDPPNYPQFKQSDPFTECFY